MVPGVEARAGGPPARFDSWQPAPAPLERALTGGLVYLRAPGSEMVRVPASRFVMGSTPLEVLGAVLDCTREPLGDHLRCSQLLFSDEMSAHPVLLSAYWLDRTEVTVRDYARCVKLGRCRAIDYAAGKLRFAREDYPVTFVSWDDARAYCRFRGARLPTEAEWERAARGVEGRRFPWGNIYNSRVSNHGRLGWAPTDLRDGFAELAPVGSFPAGKTPEGFLDLAGNVAEWVEDRYASPYPPEPATDPGGPSAATGGGGERVVRGGSYESGVPWLRGAARGAVDPSLRRPTIGFRCARSASRRSPAAP
ncbi:MAG: SUMF1/EgtB/PvdO family nonheme iron enzyme [Sorangiineae bacterium]|nr:SUMF1/EgtB/PvdO family nonheme iron enzyme [Polyangiaceae bacterium]MEB2321600.1 SUMF1/EgtB/PvdO family nonheme iron enzyme [Sorangiineae bacterium]